MTRKEIVRIIERLAFAAELKGDKRARAWSNAAWSLRSVEEDLAVMIQERRLARVRNVGPSISALVADLLDGLRPKVLDEMEAELPEGLFEIRSIKGLGAKKIKLLWQELDITSIAELEYACRENRLVDLKGFGKKTQAKVLDQIVDKKANAGKLRRDHAAAILDPLVAALPGALPTGHLPRGFDLVEELGVIVPHDDPVDAPEGVVVIHAPVGFGWEAIQRRASDEHIQALRERADELGVDPSDADDKDAVYALLGLHPTPPERREPHVPLVEVGKATTPLVSRASLRGALHNHTLASDGSHGIEEMRDAAAAAGLAYFGISEHSVSAFYARGLAAEALAKQRVKIAELNAAGAGCELLTGVESDILEHGELDYPDDVLAQLEVVIASVHRRYRHDRETYTQRMVAAARHPHTCCIGHPTGRLLLGRKPADFDVDALLDACAESGCAIELNANPARLDLSEEHLRAAKERGVLVSISADAHSMQEIRNLDHGVAIARRAGLTVDDVLNCRPLEALRAWLKRD